MARHTKEWNEGYNAAIEAIKKAIQGQNGGGQSGQDSNSLPSDMQRPPVPGADGQDQSGQQNQGNQGQNGNGNSRTNPNDSTQGIVRPEDCMSNNAAVQGTPSTPGGFFDKTSGDKLAESEGYKKEGKSESGLERDWQEAALKAANKLDTKPGTGWSDLKKTLDSLYKVTKDWKKELKMVVGRSLNKSETRRAFSNKNILASQGRHARTDKDKYDTMDYMVIWIDTSASLDDDMFKRIISEVYGIACSIKPIKLVIIQCDTKIQSITEYTNMNEFKKGKQSLQRAGDGGTAIEPMWELFKKDPKFSRKKPDLILVFTDGGFEYKYRGANESITIQRDRQKMGWLVWCILDNPTMYVANNDPMTKILHFDSKSI